MENVQLQYNYLSKYILISSFAHRTHPCSDSSLPGLPGDHHANGSLGETPGVLVGVFDLLSRGIFGILNGDPKKKLGAVSMDVPWTPTPNGS